MRIHINTSFAGLGFCYRQGDVVEHADDRQAESWIKAGLVRLPDPEPDVIETATLPVAEKEIRPSRKRKTKAN